MPVAVVREVMPMRQLTDFFDRAYKTVAETVGKQGVVITGPPIGVYFGTPTDTVEVAADFPTANQ
jgi:hypothetical protein